MIREQEIASPAPTLGSHPVFAPRIELIDALRGFALMGLFLVHMLELFELYWAHPVKGGTELLVHDIVFTLFAGKAFALLALCFGLSFFIIMDRAARRGVDFSGRFVWRLVVLGLIGLIHGVWYRGDILEVLAVMGLFLIPVNRIGSMRALWVLAVVLLLQPLMLIQIAAALGGADWANTAPRFWAEAEMPSAYLNGPFWETLRLNIGPGHSFKWIFMLESGRLSQILGLSVAGLALGRMGFFSTPERFSRARWTGFGLALATAVCLYFWREDLTGLIPSSDAVFMPRALAGMLLSSLFDLSVTIALMLGFISLYLRFSRTLSSLAPVGRMTLTLYILQSLVFVPVFYGFGLGAHATMTQVEALLIGASTFAMQMVIAGLWFRRFLYGPVEWLWRAATYVTLRVPFLRRDRLPA